MNALPNIEAQLLREHDERMSTTRGSELPKQPRSKAGESDERHEERIPLKKLALAERRRAVRRLRDEGRLYTEIARELGITERKVRWALEGR